ncbi:zf-FLZ domain-containing protein [Artemisia annua]|uniref:Zf-FLZ domain-containing protein n=1 Tax=Artemisia annua TaxID=35608 RepID=A0A2U1M912_ARTAN|nr:zf-FLZ domain-containing protein [Artemisia annua]
MRCGNEFKLRVLATVASSQRHGRDDAGEHHRQPRSRWNHVIGKQDPAVEAWGDTPFCSEECRAEQIDIDETKEKKRSLSASIKALRKKEEREKSSPSSPKYPFRSGAVAAA